VKLVIDEAVDTSPRPPALAVTSPGPASTPALTSPSANRAPFWISLAVTGALAAGTVTSGVLALGAKKDLDEELGRLPIDDAATASARSSVRSASLATDILGVATILGVGVTTVFAITTLHGDKGKPGMGVGVGLGTVSAEGRF
jgi:hypothetical protein